MPKILKQVTSPDDAGRYRKLEQQAERAAATVPGLYKESFKREARKWRLLAEAAERAAGISAHSRQPRDRDLVLEY